MSILRDYQVEDVDKIFSEWNSGVKSTLYVAATGLGKTRVMVEVAKRIKPGRTLFLCHRSELIQQAREAFTVHGMSCDIEKAELTAGTGLFNREDVVLATVQTLNSGEPDAKRMKRFRPTDFSLLLYDESHHSVSPGNKSIVDYFVQGNPYLKVLGVTATPSRSDEAALGQIFETVANERTIRFGIDNGWLVDVEQRFVPTQLDWSHIATVAGDLNQGQLSAVMESEEGIQNVVQPTLESLFRLPEQALKAVPVNEWGKHLLSLDVKRRHAIVFTVSVAQAEMLSNIFNRVIDGLSVWVCGKTSDERRLETFNDFENGGASILVNCGVTTEGYDHPPCDMIVMARPTKSRVVYQQQIGRGTRVLAGVVDGLVTPEERLAAIAASKKPHLTVMDFVGNSGKHLLLSSADLLGGSVSEEAVKRVVARHQKDGKPFRVITELADEDKKLQAEIERRRLFEEAKKRDLVARVKYSSVKVNPFDAFSLNPERQRAWDGGKTISEKQRNILLRQGIDPDSLTYSGARQVLNELFRRFRGNLCTVKQAQVLKRFGYETKNMTMKEASDLLTVIAKNGWKKPQPSEAVS